jgi:hypothetical protein
MTLPDGHTPVDASTAPLTGASAPTGASAHDVHELVEVLCEQDRAACDALCDAGFDLTRVAETLRPRCERMLRILGLLEREARVQTDAVLIDATCARVARARQSIDVTLEGLDEDAFEALVNAGMEPSRCPHAVRAAALAQASMLRELDVQVSPRDRDRVVSLTLSRVQAAITSEESRRVIPLASERRSAPKIRWSDLVSVAAVLLIGGAVLTPMLGAMRGVQQRMACSSNLSDARAGFGLYANDNRDALPMASSSTPGQQWWNIGRAEESNSANLFTMLRTGYTKPGALACNGNPRACRSAPASGAMDWGCIEEVSYSYQNMFAKERPRWVQPSKTIVLADASPVIRRAVRKEWINPLENSPNHNGNGQNVLLNDGSSQWLRSPVVRLSTDSRTDNIWLPRVLEDVIERMQNPTHADPLRGTETPVGVDDVFLAP